MWSAKSVYSKPCLSCKSTDSNAFLHLIGGSYAGDKMMEFSMSFECLCVFCSCHGFVFFARVSFSFYCNSFSFVFIVKKLGLMLRI